MYHCFVCCTLKNYVGLHRACDVVQGSIRIIWGYYPGIGISKGKGKGKYHGTSEYTGAQRVWVIPGFPKLRVPY